MANYETWTDVLERWPLALGPTVRMIESDKRVANAWRPIFPTIKTLIVLILDSVVIARWWKVSVGTEVVNSALKLSPSFK